MNKLKSSTDTLSDAEFLRKRYFPFISVLIRRQSINWTFIDLFSLVKDFPDSKRSGNCVWLSLTNIKHWWIRNSPSDLLQTFICRSLSGKTSLSALELFVCVYLLLVPKALENLIKNFPFNAGRCSVLDRQLNIYFLTVNTNFLVCINQHRGEPHSTWHEILQKTCR